MNDVVGGGALKVNRRMPGMRPKMTILPESGVVTLDEPWNLKPGQLNALNVKTGHWTCAIAINLEVPADTLLVTFEGARNAKFGNLPAFQRLNRADRFRMPILAISDPTVEKMPAEGLRGAYYFGDQQNDLIPEINALIDKACEELKIAKERAIFFGASLGGGSAMLVAARRPVARLITVNPAVDLRFAPRKKIKSMAEFLVGSVDEFERIYHEEPERLAPLRAIKKGLAEGNDIRMVVGQNRFDQICINSHYPMLCSELGLPINGGVSADGRFQNVLFEGGGHGEEPPEVSEQLTKLAHEFLMK